MGYQKDGKYYLTGVDHRRLSIACDVDGIIADFPRAAWRYNQNLGNVKEDFDVDRITEFSLKKQFPQFCYRCMEEDGFWEAMPILPVGRGFLEVLHSEIGRITLISACPKKAARKRWLETHGLGFCEFVCIEAADKPEYIKQHHFDLLIEDRPDTLLAAIGKVKKVYGIRYRYNEHVMAGSHSDLFIGNHQEVIDQILQDREQGVFD